ALAGLRAARLAAAGVTGPLDTLEHPDGFLGAFADAPLAGMLSGLGQAWATRTLCVKPYPGCAYLDTTVDALLELGPPKPEEVDRVVVEASVLTCEMDRLSRQYAAKGTPTPVTINFSVAWNVAATLLGGELTPRQTEAGWLADHEHDLRALAAKVELRHDWGLTRLATDSTPRGAAGHTSVGPSEVSRAKLAAWGPLMWGEDGTADLAAAVDADAGDLHGHL